MDEVIEFCGFLLRSLLMTLLIGAVLVGLVVWPVDYFSARACRNYHSVTGMETRYFHLDECYVRTPSGWQRWDEYKLRAITNEHE
jgi:hypothetical protein